MSNTDSDKAENVQKKGAYIILKGLFICLGYCWGIIYLTLAVMHGDGWVLVPLLAALAAGYYTLRCTMMILRLLIYFVKNKEGVGYITHIFQNMYYLLQRAKDQGDPGAVKLFVVLTLPPEQFKANLERR